MGYSVGMNGRLSLCRDGFHASLPKNAGQICFLPGVFYFLSTDRTRSRFPSTVNLTSIPPNPIPYTRSGSFW